MASNELFDAYEPGFVSDPYPTFSELRERSPIFRSPEWGVTFFARHEDVSGILKDRRFGRDVRQAVPPEEIDKEVFDRIYPPQYPNWTFYTRESFIDLEPPAHTRLRRLVQHAFTRRASNTYRPRLEAAAAGLIHAALDKGGMEAIADYATPIPLAMISDLMGIPAEDQPSLVEWSHAMVRVFDQACTPEEGQRAEQATIDFAEYIKAQLEDRRRNGGEDLINALLDAEVEGDRLTEDEIIATAILTLNAGHEATVQAIGNGLLALARFPDQYQRLRDDPDLIGSAVDELLRFDTPLQMFERWVLEDLEWKGVALKRGSKVGLLFGSANHDEAVFESPASLDLARDPNPHVSLGAGIHYCVGAPLAAVELQVAFAEFAKRIPEFSVTSEELPRVPSLIFRGVTRLELSLSA